MRVSDDLAKVLVSEEQLHARVVELAAQISKDYAFLGPKEHLLTVCMLKGAFMFMTDLVKEISLNCEIDFMAASSYGNGTESSGNVQIKKDIGDIRGLHVLIVEDIVDSGNTMHHVLELLQKREPASLRLCTLLDKPSRRKVDVKADYVGFEVPDEFVVGYGLDYASLYRNIPYIAVLKPEVYSC